MKCQKCKKNLATIHLTEIVQGQRSEMHLCQLCAESEGVAIKSQVPLNELLNSLLSAEDIDQDSSSKVSSQSETCDFCGMTWDNFRKNSLLGCPNDYDVFSKPLEDIIHNAHSGGDVHVGKVPSRADKGTEKQIKMLNLRKELGRAVKTEDYEAAANLRDEIKALGFEV